MNILLDSDGVISDFATFALNALNNKLRTNITMEEYQKTKEFSMYKVFDIPSSQFWNIIEDADIWNKMKPFPWALDIIDYCDHLGEVTICTAPSYNPQCAAAKTQWIMDNLGLRNTSVMLGTRKYLMAKPGNILIDDWSRNTNKFTEHGGKAILVPSNWNTPNLTFSMVRETIESAL